MVGVDWACVPNCCTPLLIAFLRMLAVYVQPFCATERPTRPLHFPSGALVLYPRGTPSREWGHSLYVYPVSAVHEWTCSDICSCMLALPSLSFPRHVLRRQVGLPRFPGFRLTCFTRFTPLRGFLWRGRLASKKTWTLLLASQEGRLSGWGDIVHGGKSTRPDS